MSLEVENCSSVGSFKCLSEREGGGGGRERGERGEREGVGGERGKRETETHRLMKFLRRTDYVRLLWFS